MDEFVDIFVIAVLVVMLVDEFVDIFVIAVLVDILVDVLVIGAAGAAVAALESIACLLEMLAR